MQARMLKLHAHGCVIMTVITQCKRLVVFLTDNLICCDFGIV
jgi:hypothetical protein